ncbi:MAG: hypothetical protein WD972_03395 [Candidatus Andersenbacteria bacterium]
MLVQALVVIAIVSLLGTALYQIFAQNGVKIERKERHCIVMRNGFTGTQVVYGLTDHEQGTSFWSPWWIKDEEVDLNLNRRLVDGETEIEVRTRGGVVMILEGSYDEMAGRPWNRQNGRIESLDTISPAAVLSAVNDTDYKDRMQYVREQFSKAADAVIGMYEAEQLTVPTKPENESNIPPEVDDVLGLHPVHANSIESVYRELSKVIEAHCNYRLRHVGFNVAHVTITNIKFADGALQTSLEAELRGKNLQTAASTITGALSDAEKLALVTGSSEQFGQATQAQAEKEKAAAYKHLADAIGRGIVDAVDHWKQR